MQVWPLVRLRAVSAVALILTTTVCARKESQGTPDSAKSSATSAPAATTAPTAAGPQTPDPGRKVITVEALTDDQGNNVFKPDKFEAHRGDVIRFTLKSGVHNVNFLADSNPGKTGLPAASDMLQLPGQTYDVKVTFAPGNYYFQCDPHAALGMKGRVKVEREDD